MDVLPPFDNQAFSEHNKGIVKLQLLLAKKLGWKLYTFFMANRTHALSTQELAEM